MQVYQKIGVSFFLFGWKLTVSIVFQRNYTILKSDPIDPYQEWWDADGFCDVTYLRGAQVSFAERCGVYGGICTDQIMM